MKFRDLFISLFLAIGSGLIYYFSNPQPGSYFDNSYRIAKAMLGGHLGISEHISWLEMVPLNGWYYSVFPLGAVLSLMPFAALETAGVIGGFPSSFIVALIVFVTAVFLFLLTAKYEFSLTKRIILSLFPLLGSWMWANLTFAASWQIALGFAVMGEAGALYFLIIRPNPLLAGLFFAIAFGNRTEIIAITPLMFYLLMRGRVEPRSSIYAEFPRLVKFCVVPFLLGIATLLYNYARFDSPFDFGYARLPGILEEEWYKEGIFSLSAIPGNAREMLYVTWKRLADYPYYVPTGFGGSIFLACPFLLLIFRFGARDRSLKFVAWTAILVLTFLLWIHGNAGGWQYSYRYAMVLLPWFFVLLLENSSKEVTPVELILIIVSIAINAWVTYLFHWTKYITP